MEQALIHLNSNKKHQNEAGIVKYSPNRCKMSKYSDQRVLFSWSPIIFRPDRVAPDEACADQRFLKKARRR